MGGCVIAWGIVFGPPAGGEETWTEKEKPAAIGNWQGSRLLLEQNPYGRMGGCPESDFGYNDLLRPPTKKGLHGYAYLLRENCPTS